MHLEVLIGAVTKELRAARPEVGEPGDVLFGRRGGCLVEVDRGHACSLLGRCHPRFPFWPLDWAEFITNPKGLISSELSEAGHYRELRAVRLVSKGGRPPALDATASSSSAGQSEAKNCPPFAQNKIAKGRPPGAVSAFQGCATRRKMLECERTYQCVPDRSRIFVGIFSLASFY